MIATLRRRFERAESQRASFLARIHALDVESHTRAPSEGGWSVADLLQHVVLVDEQTARQLVSPRDGARPRRTPLSRSKYLVMIAVLRTRIRIKAPAKSVIPGDAIPAAELVARWDAARGRLAAYLEGLSDRDLTRPVFRHPISGWLTVEETIGFLHAHLRHHFHQLARLEAFVSSS